MRSLVAPLSLANLLLIRIWTELLGDRADAVPPIWYAAALLNLVLLTAVLWLVARYAGFAGRLVLAVAGAALVAKEFTLSAGRDAGLLKGTAAWAVDAALRHGWLWPASGCALGAVAWAAWRTQLRWAPAALVMLSPIVVVTAGQSLYRLTQPPRSAQAAGHEPAPLVPAVKSASPARVVWMVFDEFDERVAFTQRPASVKLPAFDALRAESVVFRQAVSPSNSTSDVIPALLGDLFARNQRAGHTGGLTGWFLPYCDSYGTHLAACQEFRMDRQLNSYGEGLPTAARNQLRSLFESTLYSFFGQSLAVEGHVRTLLAMEQAAAAMAARPDLDLVFLHLPAPHPPYVYDATTRSLTATNQGSSGYLASLALADRLFASVRARMTAGGLWQSSHVLVSGDHGFRQASRLGFPADDRHVPFMWKPAGLGHPRQVAGRYEIQQTSGLIWRILEGESADGVLAGYP